MYSIRGLRRCWAQRRFVACNEHVHPLSLTSTLPGYIWPVCRYIHLSRAYVGQPQIPSCFLNVKYGRLASSRRRARHGLGERTSLGSREYQGKCSLSLSLIVQALAGYRRVCYSRVSVCRKAVASCGIPRARVSIIRRENWSRNYASPRQADLFVVNRCSQLSSKFVGPCRIRLILERSCLREARHLLLSEGGFARRGFPVSRDWQAEAGLLWKLTFSRWSSRDRI